MARAEIFLCLLACVVAVSGVAIRYQEMQDRKYQPVMIPVSSTVIPLDDLPVYKVGFGFGFDPEQFDKTLTKKGTEKKKIDLITSQSKKKDKQTKGSSPASSVNFGAKVHSVSEEDFRRFS